jgi:alginate O-acetyltransferase complex protein AlgI
VPRWYFNLFIVFLVSGIWHGANWTFIIWGALHGFYLVASLATLKLRSSIVRTLRIDRSVILHNLIRIIITFTLVNIGWIFFRANSFSDAMVFFKNMTDFSNTNIFLSVGKSQFAIAVLSIVLLEIVQTFQESRRLQAVYVRTSPTFKYAMWLALIVVIFAFGEFSPQDFIYFQF